MKHTMMVLMILLVSVVPATAQTAMEANLDACVTDYDAATDYFPDKADIQDAENLSVEYFNNYKVVEVADAYDSAPPFTYVLVQCGTPTPDAAEFPADAQFIEVPISSIVTLATTQLPGLDALGLIDTIVGVDGFDFINTPAVRERIDAGEIEAVGSGADINVELVLGLEPDLVMAFGFNPATDAHPVLLDAGVPTALNASWREGTPLGRAEWMKFTGLFYNAEAEAEAVYSDIATSYAEAVELAASIPADAQPTVLWNYFSPFSDSWTIPGGDTYIGRLIADAGGVVALGETAPDDSVDVSFEAVYDAELDADIWVANAFGIYTYDDLLASDPRFADFEAASSGDVWNNTLDVNENGGNNYYELGAANPDLVLRDMVAIFHPDLLPDHEFVFFEPLD
ncbi:MAG: ABC transporter substrate-binding protein [Chloroflexota bacterium]